MARTLTLFQNSNSNNDNNYRTKKSLSSQKTTGKCNNCFRSNATKKSIFRGGFVQKLRRFILPRAVIRTSPLCHNMKEEDEEKENSQRQTSFDSQTSTNTTTTTESNKSLVLPNGTGGFANNHVMVNMTRREHGLPTLHRIARLDEIAREHAKQMAQCKKLMQSSETYDELKEKVTSALATTTTTNKSIMGDDHDFVFVGENIQRGQNIHKMHRLCVHDQDLFENIVNIAYTKMGMGTAKGDDGYLYMCQFFSS